MQKYVLNVYQPDGGTPEPAVLDRIMRDVKAVQDEAQAAGAWVFAAGLHPAGISTVVRTKGAYLLTTDGPYAEGKEHIGGFTIIQAADLDAALEWAAKYARATTLPIEVRPVR